jgi:hypothetical protein
MFDELWSEIQDMPGEIFDMDIPELRDDNIWSEIQDMPGEIFDMDIPELRDDNKFDVEEYIKGDTDY